MIKKPKPYDLVFLYRVAKFTFSLLVLQVLERLKCCFIQWLMHDRKKKKVC